jgi:hypothetical protein
MWVIRYTRAPSSRDRQRRPRSSPLKTTRIFSLDQIDHGSQLLGRRYEAMRRFDDAGNLMPTLHQIAIPSWTVTTRLMRALTSRLAWLLGRRRRAAGYGVLLKVGASRAQRR